MSEDQWIRLSRILSDLPPVLKADLSGDHLLKSTIIYQEDVLDRLISSQPYKGKSPHRPVAVPADAGSCPGISPAKNDQSKPQASCSSSDIVNQDPRSSLGPGHIPIGSPTPKQNLHQHVQQQDPQTLPGPQQVLHPSCDPKLDSHPPPNSEQDPNPSHIPRLDDQRPLALKQNLNPSTVHEQSFEKNKILTRNDVSETTDNIAEYYLIKARLTQRPAKPSCHVFRLKTASRFLLLRFDKRCPNRLIERVLRTGLVVQQVGGQVSRYSFFGYTRNQIYSSEKECYLYDSSLGTWEDLLQEFADFQKIDSVSKRALRIGLLFSNVVCELPVTDEQIVIVKDVLRNGFNFTEGCGSISVDLAVKLFRSLGKNEEVYKHQNPECPSVFQIRLKGYKGTVVVDKTLAPGTIHIRKSMVKFEMNLVSPYVLGFVSHGISWPYNYGHLNQQFITIFSYLGVQDQVFLEKQRQYYEEIQTDFNQAPFLALKYLAMMSRQDLIEAFITSGRLCPESVRVLTKLRKRAFMLAKSSKQEDVNIRYSKAGKLNFPIENSRNVFGVCDVSGTLMPGTCFFQPTILGKATVITGEVIVVKSPCYYPGDLRRLTCVPNPHLHHLVDCVVFPTKGKRPVADEISGSDLDGDKYFICWDQDLIPEETSPMNYSAPAPESSSLETSPQTSSDMIAFFSSFNNEKIGKFDKSFHSIVSERGLGDPKTKLMSCSYGGLIDSAKTGQTEDGKLSASSDNKGSKNKGGNSSGNSSERETVASSSNKRSNPLITDREGERVRNSSERERVLNSPNKGDQSSMTSNERTKGDNFSMTTSEGKLSASNTGDRSSMPNSDRTTKTPTITELLLDTARIYIERFYHTDLDMADSPTTGTHDRLTHSELSTFLSNKQLPLSDFEIYRIIFKWCRHHHHQQDLLDELCGKFVDFTRFTTHQKHLTILDCPHLDPRTVFNGLSRSGVISLIHGDKIKRYYRVSWVKMLEVRGQGVKWDFLVRQLTMERLVLVAFTVPREDGKVWHVAMLFPGFLQRNSVTVSQMSAFLSLGEDDHSDVTSEYEVVLYRDRLQMYPKGTDKQSTFINFMKTDMVDEETVVSIALQRFSRTLSEKHRGSKIRKDKIQKLEMFCGVVDVREGPVLYVSDPVSSSGRREDRLAHVLTREGVKDNIIGSSIGKTPTGNLKRKEEKKDSCSSVAGSSPGQIIAVDEPTQNTLPYTVGSLHGKEERLPDTSHRQRTPVNVTESTRNTLHSRDGAGSPDRKEERIDDTFHQTRQQRSSGKIAGSANCLSERMEPDRNISSGKNKNWAGKSAKGGNSVSGSKDRDCFLGEGDTKRDTASQGFERVYRILRSIEKLKEKKMEKEEVEEEGEGEEKKREEEEEAKRSEKEEKLTEKKKKLNNGKRKMEKGKEKEKEIKRMQKENPDRELGKKISNKIKQLLELMDESILEVSQFIAKRIEYYTSVFEHLVLSPDDGYKVLIILVSSTTRQGMYLKVSRFLEELAERGIRLTVKHFLRFLDHLVYVENSNTDLHQLLQECQLGLFPITEREFYSETARLYYLKWTSLLTRQAMREAYRCEMVKFMKSASRPTDEDIKAYESRIPPTPNNNSTCLNPTNKVAKTKATKEADTISVSSTSCQNPRGYNQNRGGKDSKDDPVTSTSTRSVLIAEASCKEGEEGVVYLNTADRQNSVPNYQEGSGVLLTPEDDMDCCRFYGFVISTAATYMKVKINKLVYSRRHVGLRLEADISGKVFQVHRFPNFQDYRLKMRCLRLVCCRNGLPEDAGEVVGGAPCGLLEVCPVAPLVFPVRDQESGQGNEDSFLKDVGVSEANWFGNSGSEDTEETTGLSPFNQDVLLDSSLDKIQKEAEALNSLTEDKTESLSFNQQVLISADEKQRALKSLREDRTVPSSPSINQQVLTDSSLDKVQQKAVKSALHSPITLIDGARGSGKTRTLVAIIDQWRQTKIQGDILVCCITTSSMEDLRRLLISRLGKESGICYLKAEDVKERRASKDNPRIALCLYEDLLVTRNLTFESVVLDDCCHVNEMSAMLPLFYGCRRVCFSGDRSYCSDAGGLDGAIYNRFLEEGRQLIYLHHQYRCQPPVWKYVKDKFYQGQTIHTNPDNSSGAGLVEFIDVAGEENSFTNDREVEKVVQVAMDTLNHEDNFTITTVYKQQLKCIQNQLKKKVGKNNTKVLDKVEMKSLDELNGCERPVVIFSAVNTTGDFGEDYSEATIKTLLTMFTRRLVIVGNFQKLVETDLWRDLLDRSNQVVRYPEGCQTDKTKRDQRTRNHVKKPRSGNKRSTNGKSQPVPSFPHESHNDKGGSDTFIRKDRYYPKGRADNFISKDRYCENESLYKSTPTDRLQRKGKPGHEKDRLGKIIPKNGHNGKKGKPDQAIPKEVPYPHQAFPKQAPYSESSSSGQQASFSNKSPSHSRSTNPEGKPDLPESEPPTGGGGLDHVADTADSWNVVCSRTKRKR